ncbi:hypothetical protein NE237_033307 [Protea cynaroides]|uniref:Cytochrome c assembly protein domain-containing protein n=1 Tax=Protea cynaroides TaxID=273540 RepID=A0A9Q0R4R2_9MAGN|nr:hypothetical protein NE237_033307 [Protea cynaroides]
MMGITKQKFLNEQKMSINELSHYLLFPGFFVAFTYNKKQPLAFGAAPAFWCILLPFPWSFVPELCLSMNIGLTELLALLFFSPFLSASFDPFARNFFVRTELFAESNPVPQDPISAIHPPRIYAGDVASAMGIGLCRSKLMNGIDATEKNGTLLRSTGCVISRITSELFTVKFKHVGAKCYPALLLRSNRSLLMLLRRRFFTFSSLWTGALMDTGREQVKRVVSNVKKDTTTSPLCISPGSWWAHHELGRGGWWFWDPVENASFMPRVLATTRIHSIILPLLNSWTSLLNIVTLPCCALGTSSIQSGLLAPVHSFATNDTQGIFMMVLPSNDRHIYDSFLLDEAAGIGS